MAAMAVTPNTEKISSAVTDETLLGEGQVEDIERDQDLREYEAEDVVLDRRGETSVHAR